MPSFRDILSDWTRAWERLLRRPRVDPTRPPFADRYDAVFHELQPIELQRDDAPLAELDLFRVDGRRTQRFLGYYTEAGGREAFERYGFFDLLRERGFDPVLHTDITDPDEHRLRIYDAEPTNDRLLIELLIGIRELTLPNGCECRFLFVNWLQMQDPGASFEPGKPALPDQQHPGLGLFIHFAYLLKLMVDRVGCDGLLNHPSHPHNGVLYGKVCHFVDPAYEGRFRALERDIDTSDLAWLTAEVEAGRIVDDEGRPFEWKPEAQVLPVSEAARSWFRSSTFREGVKAALEASHFAHADSAP